MRISDKEFRIWLMQFASGLSDIRTIVKTEAEKDVLDRAIRCFIRTSRESTGFWVSTSSLTAKIGLEPSTWNTALLSEFVERSGFETSTPGC